MVDDNNGNGSKKWKLIYTQILIILVASLISFVATRVLFQVPENATTIERICKVSEATREIIVTFIPPVDQLPATVSEEDKAKVAHAYMELEKLECG